MKYKLAILKTAKLMPNTKTRRPNGLLAKSLIFITVTIFPCFSEKDLLMPVVDIGNTEENNNQNDCVQLHVGICGRRAYPIPSLPLSAANLNTPVIKMRYHEHDLTVLL